MTDNEGSIPGFDASDDDNDDDAVEVRSKPVRSVRAAVAMKIAGASYVEIAQTLEYRTPAAARMAVEQGLASTIEDEDDLRAVRKMSSARLEALMKSLAPNALHPKIIDPLDKDGRRMVANPDHLPYAREFLRVVDRHIRLHGADAPQLIGLVNPNAEQFEQVIGALVRGELGAPPEEGDIFEEDADGVYRERDDEENPDAAA